MTKRQKYIKYSSLVVGIIYLIFAVEESFSQQTAHAIRLPNWFWIGIYFAASALHFALAFTVSKQATEE